MSGPPEVAGHSQSDRSARSAPTVRFGSFLSSSCLAVHKMHSQQSASAPILNSTVDGWPGLALPDRPLASCHPVGAGQGEPHWQLACKLGQGSLHNPIGIGAAGKSTQHDDAANLVRQACSGHPLGSSERRVSRHFREYRRVAAERQQRLCSQKAGHRFRTKPTEGRTRRKRWLARGAYSRTNRQAQARVDRVFLRGTRRLVTCDIYMRAVMPVAGRVCATARTRGMLCRAGLISWANNRCAQSPKVR